MTGVGSMLIAATLVAAGLLAACSSDDDTSSSGSAIRPTPTSVAATETVLPTTASPTTTVASTTTLAPEIELAAAVEADFREADRLGREASMDPFDETKEAAALDRRLGVVADNFAAKLADWRDRNYALRENPDIPASITVEVPASLVLEGGDVAELQICEVNSWRVVEVGAGPGNSDVIVDPDISAARSLIFMRSVGGTWRFEGADQIGYWDGAEECQAA